jgi:hypothetical protein
MSTRGPLQRAGGQTSVSWRFPVDKFFVRILKRAAAQPISGRGSHGRRVAAVLVGVIRRHSRSLGRIAHQSWRISMVTVSVRGLPRSMNEQTLESLFGEHGRVFKMKLIKDLFSGQCKGIAELEMEGHEARAAKEAIDGRAVDGSFVRVFVDTKGAAPRGKGRRRS